MRLLSQPVAWNVFCINKMVHCEYYIYFNQIIKQRYTEHDRGGRFQKRLFQSSLIKGHFTDKATDWVSADMRPCQGTGLRKQRFLLEFCQQIYCKTKQQKNITKHPEKVNCRHA